MISLNTGVDPQLSVMFRCLIDLVMDSKNPVDIYSYELSHLIPDSIKVDLVELGLQSRIFRKMDSGRLTIDPKSLYILRLNKRGV